MLARFVAVAALACACAPPRPHLGDIRLRPYTQISGYPTVFSVQQGRLLSPAVDLTVEEDGCVRGTVHADFIQLCSKKQKGEPTEEGGLVEHWAGTGGDFTTELFEQGKKLRVDGYLKTEGVPMSMQVTVPLGVGPEWDELRKHPAFLAVAAAVSGVAGEPTDQTRPE